MSRIGKQAIEIPKDIKVDISGEKISVKGPKGMLSYNFHPKVSVKIDKEKIIVSRGSEDRISRSLHGLTRTLINNMVTGTGKGFQKALEIVGVGYKCDVESKNLVLNLGYSHPVIFPIPEGITIEVDKQTKIVVKGCDRELVGAVAAKIRSFRSPEPYKGKGIKYADERIIRKAGKTSAKK